MPPGGELTGQQPMQAAAEDEDIRQRIHASSRRTSASKRSPSSASSTIPRSMASSAESARPAAPAAPPRGARRGRGASAGQPRTGPASGRRRRDSRCPWPASAAPRTGRREHALRARSKGLTGAGRASVVRSMKAGRSVIEPRVCGVADGHGGLGVGLGRGRRAAGGHRTRRGRLYDAVVKQLIRLAANAIALAITVYVVPGLSWGDSES